MADKIETWYAALLAGTLSSLFKRWPLIVHDQIYGKFKFGHLGIFFMEKRQSGFFILLQTSKLIYAVS